MFWVLITALAAAAAVPSFQDAPAAVLVKVQGDVQVRLGAAAPVAATVGARLGVGDQVLPGSGAEAVVVHRTGRTQVVREAVTIEGAEAGAQGDMFTRTVRVFAQAANSDARQTGNRQGMIRPLPGGPAPIAPRNGLKVQDTRPTLTWFSAPGASGYRVQLREEGSPPRRFEVGGDTVFTLPADAELTRGGTYHWTVAPLQGRPVMEQTFTVATPDELAQVEGALTAIQGMGLDPADEGRLLVAVVYTDLGLLYDAARAIASLEEEGSLSADVFLLKGEVLDALGHFDEARKAFDRADGMMR
jgi:hypothetical protein